MFVYVLRSRKDGKRYIGITSDVQSRLNQHNRGKVHSTKRRRPFEVVYCEEVYDDHAARNREKYFKTAAGRRCLDHLERAGQIPVGVTRPNDRSLA